jgi:ABC-type Mn2+/Zn2+ transport system ATPase subunit
MSDMFVEFESVSVRYKETLGIDRITLGLTTGTTLGLLGPNGAGKSTCLKAMLGLIRPTSGHVRIPNDEEFGVELPTKS